RVEVLEVGVDRRAWLGVVHLEPGRLVAARPACRGLVALDQLLVAVDADDAGARAAVAFDYFGAQLPPRTRAAVRPALRSHQASGGCVSPIRARAASRRSVSAFVNSCTDAD